MRQLDTRTTRRRTLICSAVAVAGLASAACGLETEAPSEDEAGSTQALISIERNETADGVSSRAEALAGFLNVPPLVDSKSVLNLVGLGLDLPDRGSCVLHAEEAASGPLTETALVEFLDAGDVTLEVAGARERLAPYAFPTVTDSISGILYTTRDRAAGPLPSASRYTVTADGLGVRVSDDAPHVLEGVTVNGIPLAEASLVSVDNPLDLTWSIDAPGDTVYVELVSSNHSGRTLCTFADQLGAGSVPTDSFTTGDDAHVVVHRLRTRDFEMAPGEPNRAQLRFDFALNTSLRFE